jgi:thiol-disulfide isomerase/thioredoxin
MKALRGLLVLLVLVLAGCGGATSTTGTTAGEGVTGSAKTVDLDFTATTLEGEPFEGSSLAGAPTVLWFWAPWCPTCHAQIPTVSGIGEEYAGRVKVVGVGGLDTQRAIERLAGRIEHVTHLVDIEGTVWKHFRVTAQSTYTVIDADGEIVHEGYLDNGALEDLVADLAG